MASRNRAPRNAQVGGGHGGGGAGLRAMPVEMGFGRVRDGFGDPFGGGGQSPTDSMFGVEERVPITKKAPLQVRSVVCVRVVLPVGCSDPRVRS